MTRKSPREAGGSAQVDRIGKKASQGRYEAPTRGFREASQQEQEALGKVKNAEGRISSKKRQNG